MIPKDWCWRCHATFGFAWAIEERKVVDIHDLEEILDFEVSSLNTISIAGCAPSI